MQRVGNPHHHPGLSRVRVALDDLLDSLTSRNAVGLLMFLAAVIATVFVWKSRPLTGLSIPDTLLLLVLVATLALSRLFPIRIGETTQLCMGSVPLYLLCTVFVPPVAAVAAALALAVREWTTCRRCHTTIADVEAQVGRWMLLILGVSSLVQLFPNDEVLFAGALAGILLWAGDVLTLPPAMLRGSWGKCLGLSGQLARASYAGELTQYVIALFALAFIKGSDNYGITALYIPLILMTLGLLYLYLKEAEADQAAERLLKKREAEGPRQSTAQE